MESEKLYKVEVLHYINPHLIWVLTEKEGEDNIFFYEQIGIYGILPLDIKLDYEGNVKKKRSEKWLPAITVVMETILSEAAEVWFSVIYLDRRISIFDNNLHKYGDLIVKRKNGETVSMLKELKNTHFIIEDKEYFDQNLKTKLDYVTTVSVINAIKKSIKYLNKHTPHLEEKLNQQTSVFQKIVELEENSVIHNPETQWLLDKHLNNLNFSCKDLDEVPVGRAYSGNKSGLNKLLYKKLLLSKSQSSSLIDKPSLAMKKEEEWDDEVCNDESFHVRNSTEECYNRQVNNKNVNLDVTTKVVFNKKAKEVNAVIPPKGKKYIAIGPPGLNPFFFHRKEVKIDKEEVKVQKEVETNVVVTESSDDDLDKIDSEINIKIDNLDMLKFKKEADYSVTKLDKLDNSNQNSNNKTSDDGSMLPLLSDDKTSVGSLLHYNVKNPASRKMIFLQELIAKTHNSSSTTDSNSSLRKGDDSDSDSITSLFNKLDLSNRCIKKEMKIELDCHVTDVKNDVNPFKNLDGSRSVFVDKLISPTLMVHTKNGNRIQPVSNLRDISFGTEIHVILQNMSIVKPMRVQTVSWRYILRGHSLFLVSPCDSGKTIGYLPAVCRLVSDCRKSAENSSVSPLSCVIVCATAKSVSHTEELCRMFLHRARIFACYTGMTDLAISTSMLNGCDILISTPTMLVRLMCGNLGLDLRNLNMFVIDDCERINEVYHSELKFCIGKVNDMIKSRANKECKVQFIVLSRIWCDFMSNLAKKAADTIVCIAAFQECILYSKVDTSVEFLKKVNKMGALEKFLKDIDKSKKTVIACKSDDEVHLIERMLTKLKYIVFASDSKMTVQDLYSLDLALSEYQEPILGPILVCCDGNLAHLNITDAHYLVHFSLPELFSMFCKRFAVLTDNYGSIFNSQDTNVKIKIFLEDANVEQLPKILNFIKRCSRDVPILLEQMSDTIMMKKDLKKAQMFVPLCSSLLTLGKCPDIWNCKQRHAIFQDFDEPKFWMPREGVITFKILHQHSAVHYSARIMSWATLNEIKKYPQTYSVISIKMGMYYSKESNRKLHGRASPGDFCSVALKSNLFARCQVMKILKYTQKNLPCLLLINLIDEEKYEISRDTCLYHLPDELKNIDTHVAQIILSNIAPEDRDITYSKLAENQLKKITETNDDLYMKGTVSLAIGNCIFVETLEACQDLSLLNETVVKCNFRNELLDGHAIINLDHIKALNKLGENVKFMHKKEMHVQNQIVQKPLKILPKARWAHLEIDSHTPVYYLHAKSPGLLFLQHVKFQKCLNILIKDIKKYVAENPEPVTDIKEGDIVLAEFPNDKCYERARIDSGIINNKAKCFFVDLGDWATVSIDKLLPVTEKIINQLPFQAIECRLVGIKPVGEEWSEFSTNWLVDQFYDNSSNLKYLYAKPFIKEKAEFTEGHKYGIGLIDTYDNDVNINKLMIEAHLAVEDQEIQFLNTIKIEREKETRSQDSDCNEQIFLSSGNVILPVEKEISKSDSACISKNESDTTNTTLETINNKVTNVSAINNISNDQQAMMNLLRDVPLRSLPLVENGNIDDDKWDFLNPQEMLMNPNPTLTSGSSENLCHNNAKVLPPAICYSKSDTIEDRDEALHLENKAIQNVSPPEKEEIDKWKKPKLVWRQSKNRVTIKILLITDKYDLHIKDKHLLFSAYASDEKYGFDFELYGVVEVKTSSHSNKGRYILVNLCKVMPINWFTLTESYIGKWITYDVDGIDVSSEEEESFVDEVNNLKNNLNLNDESESDDNFDDDIDFAYKKSH